MNVRSFLKPIAAVLIAGLVIGTLAQAQTEIRWWYSLTGALGELMVAQAEEFNASQDRFVVKPEFAGSYDEAMVAAIAASRAGTAPHIVQMFEVGTATMMHAGGAIKPVYELFAETGVPFDPDVFLAAVRGYYSMPDGRMMSMPFNSSTAVMWVNNDALAAAGFDPATIDLSTWEKVRAAAKQIVDAGAAPCGFNMSWPTWTQFEQFGAVHDIPLATLANGMEGLGAELLVNHPLRVQHIQNLMDMRTDGSFQYGGRGSAGDGQFVTGECAINHGSSGFMARVLREAEFDWSMHMLPYYEGTPNAPLNSIIGGASMWVMQAPGRTAEEWQGVAEFLAFLTSMPQVEIWHTNTGFMPIRLDVFEKLLAEGFYDDKPAMRLPVEQLTRGTPTENSRGLRLGNMPQIRAIIEEEIEIAFEGRQTAQRALDNAVERGNVVLRAFERAHR